MIIKSSDDDLSTCLLQEIKLLWCRNHKIVVNRKMCGSCRELLFVDFEFFKLKLSIFVQFDLARSVPSRAAKMAPRCRLILPVREYFGQLTKPFEALKAPNSSRSLSPLPDNITKFELTSCYEQSVRILIFTNFTIWKRFSSQFYWHEKLLARICYVLFRTQNLAGLYFRYHSRLEMKRLNDWSIKNVVKKRKSGFARIAESTKCRCIFVSTNLNTRRDENLLSGCQTRLPSNSGWALISTLKMCKIARLVCLHQFRVFHRRHSVDYNLDRACFSSWRRRIGH